MNDYFLKKFSNYSSMPDKGLVHLVNWEFENYRFGAYFRSYGYYPKFYLYLKIFSSICKKKK